MNSAGKRMAVLSDGKIKQVYGLPKFTDEQRNTYFALNPSEKQEVAKLRSLRIKSLFILQLGYFKANKMFFVFEFAEGHLTTCSIYIFAGLGKNTQYGIF